MKKRSIKLLALLLSGLLAASALAGCAKGKEKEEDKQSTGTGGSSEVYAENGLPKNEKVTLKVAFFEAGYGREYVDELAAAFSKKFPNVKIELTASPKIGDIINPKIAANDNEDMYDFFLPSGVKTQDLINAGKLEAFDILDREPYDMKGSKLRDLIPSAAYENMALDEKGNPYAINMSAAMRGLFYDKAFFKQNGWNENPKTWSEFLALCESIKAKGVSPIISFGNYIDYMTKPKILEMAEVVGDKDMEKNFVEYGVPFYSSKAYVELYKRVAELGSKGYFDKGTGAVSHTESQMMAIQHKVALVPSGTWIENEMKDATPEGFEWGFMTVPFRNTADQKMYGDYSASGSSFFIWKDKPELNKKWAKEFKLFMLSMEGQEIIAKSGQIPVRIEYTKDQKKIETLEPMAKTVLNYYEKNSVELFNQGFHTHTINDPNFSQWNKLYFETIPGIAKGEVKDIEAKLKEIDSYLEKSQPAKVKNVK